MLPRPFESSSGQIRSTEVNSHDVRLAFAHEKKANISVSRLFQVGFQWISNILNGFSAVKQRSKRQKEAFRVQANRTLKHFRSQRPLEAFMTWLGL